MPAVYTDPLILDIMARTDKLERAMKGARAQFTTEAEQMKRASAAMRKQMESDSAGASAAFKRMAGAIGGYFSGREIIALTNSFTQFQNSLRVAGVASSDLSAVQERLFATAQKYGVEIGTLGQLFGSLTNASKELGASQEQIFKLTDVVSASLRVSGQSASEAGGALLQLGQALRGGKVQAEEYNSLLDGMYPLLEAAAAGSDRWGGSVAKLTADVKNGTVASQELFSAILTGSGDVIKRAELSTLSLAGAFTQLKNALTVYVGEAAQSSGAQAALAAGIGKIAENLDSLIPALAIVGAAMGVKYVVAAGAATLATVRTDAALLGLTTRAEVAGFAMGALARALAINGAILAVTAAIGSMAAEIATTDSLVRQANTQFDEMRGRLEATEAGARAAGDGSRSVGDGAASAEPKVRAFAGAVEDLADQLYRQAQAARTARTEMLEKRLADSRTAEVELGRRTPAGRNASAGDFRRGDFLNNAGIIGRAATGSLRNFLSGGRTDREANDAYTKQVAVSVDLQRQLRAARAAPLTSYVPKASSAPAPARTSAGRGRTSAGSTSSTSGSADQRREAQQRIDADIANAQVGYLQELAQTTQNAADRADLEKRVIEAMRAVNEREIGNNESLNDAQRQKLVEINNQVAGLRVQQIADREADRLRQQQLTLTAQALRDEDAQLQLKARLADSSAERRDIELRRVDIAYRLERAGIAEELAQAEIAGDTDRIAAARKRLADLEERRVLETKGVRRDTESPGERYMREINKTSAQIGDDIEAVGARGLDRLNDGLVDAITGAKSLGDVFSDVADQIIGDLLRIAIQQAVIKPLANALFDGAGSGGGGGGGGLRALAGLIFGTAAPPAEDLGFGPIATAGGSLEPWRAKA
ncbi:hypothetical protein ASE86_13280 [Sphingomonas sp. Leaf33]|uniref:tape measure protein n=1 Tax=Sphingomonas sp. Leaf33 TaxID=1736215 RepID=UPI0006F32EC9|nr:tape measure protein [Sphingomonas sp. Leaf33]KQN19438.1 hypothetical protein ASE86_13280 [Sphingomonas sp. Leaf33]